MRVVEEALIRLPIGEGEYYDHDILKEIYNVRQVVRLGLGVG